MRWSIAAIAALSLLACNRSDLLDETSCDADGRFVVVENNAFCVFPEAGTFPCPDALPFVVRFAGAGFCAIEEDPPEPLLGAALDVALDIDAGTPDDAGIGDADAPDGVIIDGGAVDGAVPDAQPEL